MDYLATIRLTIEAPFKVAGGVLPANATPEQAAQVEQERIASATYAEQVLIDRLTRAIGKKGVVVAVLVEEVAER